MIYIKIHYGLGNQLFQYALAKSLANKLNYNLKLDLSFYHSNFQTKHPRLFLLNKFEIKLNSATDSELKLFKNRSLLIRQLERFNNLFTEYYKKRIVYEKSLQFDDNIFKINNKSYLVGYWQDERYFSEYAPDIRRDLVFKEPPIGLNSLLFGEIQSKQHSVCIHIRRGDYLSDEYIQKEVGICNMDFYHVAVKSIVKRIENPFFYVFSDEPEWVKNNFFIPFPYKILDHNSEADAAEDLRLMSACRHQIISNSSFGWWAAWLNEYKSKIVIAPKVWRINGPDMYIPKEWERT